MYGYDREGDDVAERSHCGYSSLTEAHVHHVVCDSCGGISYERRQEDCIKLVKIFSDVGMKYQTYLVRPQCSSGHSISPTR